MIETPQCRIRGCKHFRGSVMEGGDEFTERPVCAAFPNGIPERIAYGIDKHLTSVDGDNGIHFEEEAGKALTGEGYEENTAESVMDDWIKQARSMVGESTGANGLHLTDEKDGRK